MAKLYVSEYVLAGAVGIGGNLVPVAAEPSNTEQTVTYSTTTQSNAFAGNTTFIRVHTDSICSIAIGLNPTATVSTKRMAANQTEYFFVAPGHKIAAVTNT